MTAISFCVELVMTNYKSRSPLLQYQYTTCQAKSQQAFQKNFFIFFKKGVDKSASLCYNVITERARKPAE